MSKTTTESLIGTYAIAATALTMLALFVAFPSMRTAGRAILAPTFVFAFLYLLSFALVGLRYPDALERPVGWLKSA